MMSNKNTKARELSLICAQNFKSTHFTLHLLSLFASRKVAQNVVEPDLLMVRDLPVAPRNLSAPLRVLLLLEFLVYDYYTVRKFK